ncbi:MAG: endonuclease MutS2 [Bacteroidota bacterium]
MNIEGARRKLDFERVLAWIVQQASSDLGRSRLQDPPFSDSSAAIRDELGRVSEMKRLLEEEDALPLAGARDIRRSLHRSSIPGACLQGREFVEVLGTLKAARAVRSFLVRRRASHPVLAAMAEPLAADRVMEYNIEQAVDESGGVRDGASRELREIRRSLNERAAALRRKLEGILRSASTLGYSQEEIITTREGRMVIPVKAEFKHQVPGFIHSASSSGATVFIEPAETLDLNNEIRNLHFQEQREEERILRTLTSQVAKLREPLLASCEILAHLDALAAKARYSMIVLGTEPVITEDGPVRLVDARHPVLLMTHGREGTVPLSLEMGTDSGTLLISGPNAGGKSVAMKCVGLLALMAQSGFHVPAAAGTTLRVFGKMFVDIGDDQSVENDLSTFSSHLANLRAIAEEADECSLVLIDEIGAGTDPREGGAIAAALLEFLTRRGALTIATTHHGALKAFAHQTPGIRNAAMEFDSATLTPTYRLRVGVPGSSYALEMASRLGLRADLLERARSLMGDQAVRLDSLIGELEAARHSLSQEAEAQAEERERLDGLTREYEKRLEAHRTEAREIRRRALDEAREILDGAQAAIERSVRAVRETAAAKPVVQSARREVEDLRRAVDRLRREEDAEGGPGPSAPPVPGEKVRLKSGGDAGEVLEIAPGGETALVLFGSVRMRVPLDDLLPGGEVPAPGVASSGDLRTERRELRTELDLRGMTGEEALPLIDKLLDDALLTGINRVDIIHGKGTGALRKKVSEYLGRHPLVLSFHLAEWNEGGTGATVVELKDRT